MPLPNLGLLTRQKVEPPREDLYELPNNERGLLDSVM